MGEHGNAFKFKYVKAINKIVNPSVDMDGKSSKTIVTYEYQPGGLINYSEGEFPPNPDKNEVCIVGGVFYIYELRGTILEWYPLGGGGGGDIVAASNVIEDPTHLFVTQNQIDAINEVVQGQVPAPKIIEDDDHNFVDNTQIDAINNLMEGVEIDGGNLD